MLNYNSTMLNSGDAKKLAAFYEKVFDKKPEMQDGDYYGWVVGTAFFGVGQHSEVKGNAKDPDRVLFNFETKEVKEEFERISKIDGVKVVKEPYNMSEEGGDPSMEKFWIATLADPEGNLFQLVTPWDEGK
jgi:predicted enzyme related to lactoylglutathione lyase